MLEHITNNLQGSQVRHDRMEGREYLVAPMAMITEGVHNGSQGPLYYPWDELSKFPQVWNMKPVVVYHPSIMLKMSSSLKTCKVWPKVLAVPLPCFIKMKHLGS